MAFRSSIRLRLAITLFAGFIVLLGLASTGIYFVARHIFQEDFDTRLYAKAQAALASISQKGNSLDVDWAELPQELNPHKHPRDAIQIIDSEGHTYFDAPAPVPSTLAGLSGGVYEDQFLNALGPVRVLTLPFVPRVEEEDVATTPENLRKSCILVVAGSRAPLDHSLRKLAGILILMTGVASLFSLVMVWVIVTNGLRPLNKLGAAMAKVEADSLGQRIEVNDLPVELVAIAGRLNDLLGRLDISFSRERRFSADVSHELRTPVAELKTLSEVMLEETADSPQFRQAFEDARQIAGQMEALVTVLLEMVRQEEGSRQMPLPLSEIELTSQARSVWRKFESRAQARNLTINWKWSQEKIVLRTEPHLFATVLGQLFDNAIDYSVPGSVIEVDFRPGENSRLIVSNRAESLVQSDIPRLFDRFWRKDKARSESSHFGLGLALSRMICQRLAMVLTASLDRRSVVSFQLQFPKPSR